jgi:hypothetical protein
VPRLRAGGTGAGAGGRQARIGRPKNADAGGLAPFSGLYYAIAVLSDATYREEFLAELQTSLRVTFADRARYLQARAAAG